jgi:2-keto-4-pentenoate hydratase/2-oxohepta-3-ene-1,7-dioic acid hydratase in catechol pathway
VCLRSWPSASTHQVSNSSPTLFFSSIFSNYFSRRHSVAPVSDFALADDVPNPQNLDITMTVNGQLRQKGNTSQMLFNIPSIVIHCARAFTLYEGDLIFTGTP